MITSTGNAQVKNIIQLMQKTKARREQGLFVAEGRKMFYEAPRHWIQKVYISETLAQDENFLGTAQGLDFEVVSDKVFRQMSDTQTPQGVLTVLKRPYYTMEQMLSGENPLLLVLEDLQDPGNVGTILRTGEGAGVQGVFLTKSTVDVFNPKVIRSTMGSIYRIPFLYVEDVPALQEKMKKHGVRMFAAHLNGKNTYDRESYAGGTAFLIGNEGNGLSSSACACADTWIQIPMAGRVESLNAAMAAGILMYEAARQRRSS
ncbi:MAG: RNA methyltransferase [Eubacteriales bacterium]|nr:RNA methyltransferase [Eubacteriales bacterium]